MTGTYEKAIAILAAKLIDLKADDQVSEAFRRGLQTAIRILEREINHERSKPSQTEPPPVP